MNLNSDNSQENIFDNSKENNRIKKKEGFIEENIVKLIWMKIKMKQMEMKKSYLNQKKI